MNKKAKLLEQLLSRYLQASREKSPKALRSTLIENWARNKDASAGDRDDQFP